MFDRGISYEGDLVDLAVLTNIIEKSGMVWLQRHAARAGS